MSSNQQLANIPQKLKHHVEFLIELFCTDALPVTELLVFCSHCGHFYVRRWTMVTLVGYSLLLAVLKEIVFSLEMYCYLSPSGHVCGEHNTNTNKVR